MKKTFTFLLIALASITFKAQAQTDLIISEYGEGWGSNKYIELFNPTSSAINLKDYQIKRYSNGSKTDPTDAYVVSLPDFNLEPYKAYVITQDKRESAGTVGAEDSPIWAQLEARGDLFVNSSYDNAIAGSKCIQWNGDDAVTLEKTSGTIVDIFGKVGERPSEATVPNSTTKTRSWTSTAPYNTGLGIGLSADHSLVRKSSVSTGVKINPTSFNILAEYDSLPPNTFDNLGWHAFDGAPANSIPVFDMATLFAVSPLAEEGEVALTLNATDADAGQNIEYYIVSGNFIYIGEGDDAVRHEPFTLEKTTGILRVADEEALAEASEDIYFNVVACDEYGQSEVFSFDVRITEGSLGLNEVEFVEVSIAPNPASNFFTIKAEQAIVSIEVFNFAGKSVLKKATNNSLVEINHRLDAGAYLVRTNLSDNSAQVNKLIIR